MCLAKKSSTKKITAEEKPGEKKLVPKKESRGKKVEISDKKKPKESEHKKVEEVVRTTSTRVEKESELKEVSLEEEKQKSLWGWLKPKSSKEKQSKLLKPGEEPNKIPVKPEAQQNGGKPGAQATANIHTKRRVPPVKKQQQQQNHTDVGDDRSVNDATEFLENAQLTKLMSNADIRAALGGQVNHDAIDETSCRDTIDEVDSEMPDMVFSPLLQRVAKQEEARPIHVNCGMFQQVDSLMPLHHSKSKEKN
ncbi:unnamed protein product [Caenorhabditis angaria]|uniref:Uncharacterized protein n=1 Tax=Caenorhabditis angaria TaxID=860376 RepID=A0A9P1MX94_9PELO|nr:unnamed protein product [Caenorhabditis angaria]